MAAVGLRIPLGPAGRTDTGAFLARLLRLDPGAVVRLAPAGAGLRLWAHLPFDVLVTRVVVAVDEPPDATVSAKDLLRALDPPADDAALVRRDHDWRWPLPPLPGQEVEAIPVGDIARIAQAASQALRAASTEGVGGRAVGERMLRDALLDHVPIIVTDPHGTRVEVSQRLVQGLVRMGFLGPNRGPNRGRNGSQQTPSKAVGEAGNYGSTTADLSLERDTESDSSVTVRRSGLWIGLVAEYGSAWYRRSSPFRLQVR